MMTDLSNPNGADATGTAGSNPERPGWAAGTTLMHFCNDPIAQIRADL